jgi:anaerobic selenocysteine-containing dehydrogenase
MTVRQARCVCPYDCPDTCSMLLTIENDRIVRVSGDKAHPVTAGFLCHKVSRWPERIYHRDRLMFPQRRIGPKGTGRFERISWDEALDEIACRFREIAAGPDGPQAILPYSYCGTMGKIQSEGMDRRFFHRLGASLLDRTICATAGMVGYRFTIGTGQGMDPEAFTDSRYIINWGSNTAVTNSHLWVKMVSARKKGAKIVTIDPYRSPTAAKSDWHLAPRPGTDAALALGMMHVLFRDGLQDEHYLQSACVGADQLRERVLTEYRVDRVAEITGLPANDIVQLTHEYARSRPAAIRVNYGLQRHAGGGMAIRTIACLPAVTGAWKFRSGGILLSTSALFPFDYASLQRPDLIRPGTRTVNMTQLAEALHGELPGPPVKALYVYNSNPAAVAPDQQRVLRGLLREDLFTVVHEQFPTDTTRYADILLPATMQPEHFDLHHAYGHHFVQLNLPAVPAPGECRSNSDVFRGLAERLNFEPDVCQMSDEDLIRKALWEHPDGSGQREDTPPALRGITWDSLTTEGPQKLRVSTEPPFAEGRFPTPSGRCELYSARMAELGFDPLPKWTPPAESPVSAPDLAARYPLQMLCPPSPHFLNSTFVEVESLRECAGTPELEIHPEDAIDRGILDGQPVHVWNDRGRFTATARVRESVRPGLVLAAGIWWSRFTPDGSNANSTTSSRLADFGGGATFFDNLVEVSAQREFTTQESRA